MIGVNLGVNKYSLLNDFVEAIAHTDSLLGPGLCTVDLFLLVTARSLLTRSCEVFPVNRALYAFEPRVSTLKHGNYSA